MKAALRRYILRHAWRGPWVPLGKRGEISKIDEEVAELKAATGAHALIEACDVIDAALRYATKQHNTPSIAVIALVFARRAWKPVRNKILDWLDLDRPDFVENSQSGEKFEWR